MSIYPKKIKLGEPVNIHFRIHNNNSKIIKGEIVIRIESRNTKTILSKKISVKKDYIINYYFRYFPYDLGKHKVTGLFKMKGKSYFSRTIKKDYFNVINDYSDGKNLSYYLYALAPKEKYNDLLKDSEIIIKGGKKVKTEIGKIFLSKLHSPIAKDLMKSKDYKKVMEAKYD